MNPQKEPLLKENALKKCLFWEFCVPKGHCWGMDISGPVWTGHVLGHTVKKQNPKRELSIDKSLSL